MSLLDSNVKAIDNLIKELVENRKKLHEMIKSIEDFRNNLNFLAHFLKLW